MRIVFFIAAFIMLQGCVGGGENKVDRVDNMDLVDKSEQIDKDEQADQAVTPDNDAAANDKFPAGTTQKQKDSLSQLFPDATHFETGTSDGRKYFTAKDSGDKVLGYAFESSVQGYQSMITNHTGINAAGTSIKVNTLAQSDSFWSYMTQTFFDQFKGIEISKIKLSPKYDPNCFPCKEMYDLFNDYKVDAVSGATYTSNAITRNVLNAFYSFDALPKQ